MNELEAIESITDLKNDIIKDSVLKQALAIGISALEKQIPKKIKAEQWTHTKCECGKTFSIGGYDGYYRVPYEYRTNYCSDCGQKRDWSVD